MNNFNVFSIGKIINQEGSVGVVLDKKFVAALTGLEEYSHVQILWWADRCDNEEQRATVTTEKPYTKGPDVLGVFAMHSPERPNPIAVSNVEIDPVAKDAGIVWLYYIDAFAGTPVLDLKPYMPSLDRVENATVPKWCAHWPKSYEESASYDWEPEFNF